jgi:hypothetical protein
MLTSTMVHVTIAMVVVFGFVDYVLEESRVHEVVFVARVMTRTLNLPELDKK